MDGLNRLATERPGALDRFGRIAPVTTGRLSREIAWFAAIGLVSTLAYAVLYTAARTVASATTANLLALVITALGNTAANRRLTFGIAGRASLLRHHAAGFAALGLALAITTVAVVGLDALVPASSRPLELIVLLGANALATVVRFVVLRRFVRPRIDESAIG